MPTKITVNKKLAVQSLFDIQNSSFAHWYGLGVWWAMYGDEQGDGPQPDDYLIGNIASHIKSGWYKNLTSEHLPAVGFYFGMIHGGMLEPLDLQVRPHGTIVKLTDPDFVRGYAVGRKEQRQVTDAFFISVVNQWSLESPSYQALAFELGRWVGNLSFALKPVILPAPVS